MGEEAFVAKLEELAKVSPGELSDSTEITPEAWDSVDVLDLIAAIDEGFGTTVPTQDLNRCKTVGDLRQLIRTSAGA